MNCFNYADRAAVGICKACQKGLCTECAADLGFGIACRGVHEQRVKEVEELISRNSRVYKSAGGARYVAPLFLLFTGSVFTGYGLMYSRNDKFIVLLGIGFLVYGIYAFVANLRAFGKIKT